MKKVWDIVYGVVLLFLVIIMVSVVLQLFTGSKPVSVFGYSVSDVLTGSMRPTIEEGSLIVVKAKDDYSIGDIISYINEEGQPITHRIVNMEGDEIITRGDANNASDEPFSKSNIIGEVVAIVPSLGSFLTSVQKSVIPVILIVVAVVFLLLDLCRDNKRRSKYERDV